MKLWFIRLYRLFVAPLNIVDLGKEGQKISLTATAETSNFCAPQINLAGHIFPRESVLLFEREAEKARLIDGVRWVGS